MNLASSKPDRTQAPPSASGARSPPGRDGSARGRRSCGGHDERRGHEQQRDEQQRPEHTHLVAEEAEHRRAGEEGGVPDRGDHADPRGGVRLLVGGRAHPDREAERGAEPPEDDPGGDHDVSTWPNTNEPARPAPATAMHPHSTGSRPNRSSSSGPPTSPDGHRGDEQREPLAPSHAGTAYPSTSATASQSLATPSVSAIDSTKSPIARVRGSVHARQPGCAAPRSRPPPPRRAGSPDDGERHAHHQHGGERQVHGDRDPQARGRGPHRRAGHRAEAERRVEPGA